MTTSIDDVTEAMKDVVDPELRNQCCRFGFNL